MADVNNITISDVDFAKYDDLCFNPFRYECTNISSRSDNDDHMKELYNIPKYPYFTPERFKLNSFHQFTILNLNIRSLG